MRRVMSRVEGEWLADFVCFGCGERGPGAAVVLGEVALCLECIKDGMGEAFRDCRQRGADPLRPYDDEETGR
jgi:hypothetical protein